MKNARSKNMKEEIKMNILLTGNAQTHLALINLLAAFTDVAFLALFMTHTFIHDLVVFLLRSS